jgi:tight adherence protein C
MTPTLAPNLPVLFGLLIALGLYLVAMNLSLGRERPDLEEWLRRRERRPAGGGPIEPAPTFASPLTGGLLAPLLRQAADRTLRAAAQLGLIGAGDLARRLALAGHGTPLDHYVQKVAAAAALAAGALGLLGALAALGAVGLRAPALPWWLPLLAGALGFLLPDLAVARRVARRRALVRAELPRLLDRLALCLAAKQSIPAGLDSAVARGGPLAPVLAEALARTRGGGGATLETALHEQAERLELAELHTLATTLGLGDRRGVTVRAALAALAEDLRAGERRRLERAGHAATLRQLVPVGLCIFPAFVLVVLLPAVAAFLALPTR